MTSETSKKSDIPYRLGRETVAVLGAFALTGPVYGLSVSWVRDYSIEQYGSWTGDVTAFVWGTACALLLYSALRKGIDALGYGLKVLVAKRIFQPW